MKSSAKKTEIETPTAIQCKHTTDCDPTCQASQRGLWVAPDNGTWFVYYAHDTHEVVEDNGNSYFGSYDQVICQTDSKFKADAIVLCINEVKDN